MPLPSNQLSPCYLQQGFALKYVVMSSERATASEECKQLTWFSLHVVSDTSRLTLTDWLRLRETTKGCEPASVSVCDCICLSMRLCSDKRHRCVSDWQSILVHQGGWLSPSEKACHCSWFRRILVYVFGLHNAGIQKLLGSFTFLEMIPH